MADIFLIAVINGSELEGYSFPLLQHFFGHYLACGIHPANMRVVLINESPLPEASFLLRELSIRHEQIISAPLDEAHRRKKQKQLLKGVPRNAWVIRPALEEFIAFPRPLTDLIAALEKDGYDSLAGWIWDRFDQNFALKEIEADHPIHLQFPLAVEYSAQALLADTRREVLVLHRTLFKGSRSFFPAPTSWEVRIDNYKWTSGLRMKVRRAELSSRTEQSAADAEHKHLKKLMRMTPEGVFLTSNVTRHVSARLDQARKKAQHFRFIHIPKTAGTTIFKIVREWFPEINRVIAWHKLSEDVQRSINDERFVFGHIPLRHFHFGADAMWFTILRNPMEQAVSCYYEHARNYGRRPPQDQELIGEGLEPLLTSGKLAYIWPSPIRYLSTVPKDAGDREMIESAKQNLRRFTAVGFYDELEVFIQKMAAALGQPIPARIPHANYNPSKPETLQLSPEAAQALERMTAPDMEVYNYAKQCFHASSIPQKARNFAGTDPHSPVGNFLSRLLSESEKVAAR